MTGGWAAGRGVDHGPGVVERGPELFGLCERQGGLGLGQPREEEESGGVGWL